MGKIFVRGKEKYSLKNTRKNMIKKKKPCKGKMIISQKKHVPIKFSMKFCLLVTTALDIFIKEKNNTLYLPWISPLSFFYAKGVYSDKLSGKVPY